MNRLVEIENYKLLLCNTYRRRSFPNADRNYLASCLEFPVDLSNISGASI